MNFLLNPLNLCELWHSEHSEHSDSPTATFPPTSVRFPTHKKISEIRGICVRQGIAFFWGNYLQFAVGLINFV